MVNGCQLRAWLTYSSDIWTLGGACLVLLLGLNLVFAKADGQTGKAKVRLRVCCCVRSVNMVLNLLSTLLESILRLDYFT